MKLKALEKRLLKAYNDSFRMSLILSKERYNRFDAYNDMQIAELKVRTDDYPNTLIEFDKYAYNTRYCQIFGKEFLYIVGTLKGIFVFNITDLDIDNYDYRWEWRTMPSQTEFGNGEIMKKMVGYIDWGMSCLEIV